MPLISGTRLGAYEIVARIGTGGMGSVYRALPYDVMPDGRVMINTVGGVTVPIVVTLNWRAVDSK